MENHGIVFIDEIDKICKRGESSGPDVSREGVQRDLLPLVEGCTVNTKHGMVRSDHILFIASGAFQVARPSDLIPELQGRLPIRVELDALSTDDFERILTEPNASLTEQYRALLATEQVTLKFTADGIRRIAEAAWQVNDRITSYNVCYTKLLRFRAEAVQKPQLEAFMTALAELLRPRAERLSGLQLIGPLTALMERRAGKYRMQLLLQAASRASLGRLLGEALPHIETLPEARRARWSLDVDPQDLF